MKMPMPGLMGLLGFLVGVGARGVLVGWVGVEVLDDQ